MVSDRDRTAKGLVVVTDEFWPNCGLGNNGVAVGVIGYRCEMDEWRQVEIPGFRGLYSCTVEYFGM